MGGNPIHQVQILLIQTANLCSGSLDRGASQVGVCVHVDELQISHVDPGTEDGGPKQNRHLGDPEPQLAAQKKNKKRTQQRLTFGARDSMSLVL